jgi:MFS family permease
VNLLVPLQLEANGLSPGSIGLIISSASAIFVAVSVVVTRMGGRAMSLGLAAWAALVYGLLLVVPVASAATAAVVAFVVLRAPAWGVVTTLSFPFGSHGAERARIGQGTIMGLLNVVWGASSTAGPLIAGGVTDAVGDPRWGYVPAVLVAIAAGWWLGYGSTGGNRARRSRAVTSM